MVELYIGALPSVFNWIYFLLHILYELYISHPVLELTLLDNCIP
jgi:hypothetical protein